MFAAFLSNAFEDFADDPTYENTTATYTIIPLVMDNLPIMFLIAAVIIGIVLYGKAQMGRSGL